MQVNNVQAHTGLPFADYLKLPGTSFSSLKPAFAQTEGMRIGTLVHTYILKPWQYEYEESEIVIPVARELIRVVGHTLLRQCINETPLTADFVHDGFCLPWRGVPDSRLRNILTIDYKVIKGDLLDYLERFNYPEQLNGYCLGGNTPDGMIIAYNRSRKKVQIHTQKCCSKFWENIVLTRGKVI